MTALQFRSMELKRLITRFTYRIEPKPEGGFIAHATDPTVPPLEAATREELQRKIQETIFAGLSSAFPGWKLPVDNERLKLAFHVERNPDGGFAIHSADPNTPPVEGATHDDIQSHFAEKFINFVGKHLAPEISQALMNQANAADIKISVNRQTIFHSGPDAQQLSVGSEKGSQIESGGTLDRRPIAPEKSNFGTVLRFLIGLLVLFALMYFFLHRR